MYAIRSYYDTRGRGFSEITDEVANAIAASGVQTGLAHVFTARNNFV